MIIVQFISLLWLSLARAISFKEPATTYLCFGSHPLSPVIISPFLISAY